MNKATPAEDHRHSLGRANEMIMDEIRCRIGLPKFHSSVQTMLGAELQYSPDTTKLSGVWRFAPDKLFRPNKLMVWFAPLDWENVLVRSIDVGGRILLPVSKTAIPLGLVIANQPSWPAIGPGQTIDISLLATKPIDGLGLYMLGRTVG